MRLYSTIVDDFFDDPQSVRNYAIKQKFVDVTSPVDNITYPDICLDLSQEIKDELHSKLALLMGKKVSKSVEFLRLSRKGIKLPYQAHTDTAMGKYTALVYLNLPEDCIGSGTSLVKHINGMEFNPATQEGVDVWARDTNVYDNWKVNLFCPAAFNRLLLFNADLFHRAEPPQGFGDSLENGRLVLICFFNTEEKS